MPRNNGATDWNVELTGRKLKYQRVRVVTTSVIVATSGTSIINIFATPGYIARVKLIAAFLPAIVAATGNQGIVAAIGSSSYTPEQLVSVLGANGAACSIKYESPNNVSFDSSTPLVIVFTNSSDKPTDGITSRMYTVIYEEEAITP